MDKQAQDIKISIIVPVYNNDKLLPKCLDSIQRQTFHQIEVILVDDGSTDSSGAICDQYAMSDDRFKVFHQKNQGHSVARNLGIKHATGEFIGFVDSDDYILDDMYRKLLKLCLDYEADIAVCDYFINSPDHEEISPKQQILVKEEFMPLILTDTMPSLVWNKLYRTRIFQGIEFPEGFVAQDMGTMFLIFNNAETLVSTNEKLYVYFDDNPNNTTNSAKLKFRGSYHRLLMTERQYIFARQYYPQSANSILKRMVRFIQSSYIKSLMEAAHKEERQIILSKLKKYNTDIENATGIGVQTRLLNRMIINENDAVLRICGKFYVLFLLRYRKDS